MQLPPYGAFDPVFPGEEHLSCSGRLLLSRRVTANVIDYLREFWRYRYCRKLGRKHGKSVDAGGRFRLPYFEWKPWFKRVHAVALQLPEFIAMPWTA